MKAGQISKYDITITPGLVQNWILMYLGNNNWALDFLYSRDEMTLNSFETINVAINKTKKNNFFRSSVS